MLYLSSFQETRTSKTLPLPRPQIYDFELEPSQYYKRNKKSPEGILWPSPKLEGTLLDMSSPPRMRSAFSASAHKSKEVHLRASDPKLEEISTDVSAKKKKKKKNTSFTLLSTTKNIILRGNNPPWTVDIITVLLTRAYALFDLQLYFYKGAFLLSTQDFKIIKTK